VRQSHGFETGWNAVVAVLTGTTPRVFEFERSAAEFAGTCQHHIVSLTLNPRFRLFCMTDTQVSVAARQLAARRWGSQRATRLARELESRVGQLPAAERIRLLDALARLEGETCYEPDPTSSPMT
jgi:hypothetical protein